MKRRHFFSSLVAAAAFCLGLRARRPLTPLEQWRIEMQRQIAARRANPHALHAFPFPMCYKEVS